MCGRYYISIEDSLAFLKINKKIEQLRIDFAKEEVFPGQRSLVLVAGNNDYDLDVMKWGLKAMKGHMLINARKEGIQHKKTFQPMLKQRCLIPCNGFYEWKEKKKIFVYEQQEPLIYLAGIYNQNKEFVIVTGDSQNDMLLIHHRTPLIIHEAGITAYLNHQSDFVVDNDGLSFRLGN